MLERKAIPFLSIQLAAGLVLLGLIVINPTFTVFGQRTDSADLLYVLPFPVLFAAIHFECVALILSHSNSISIAYKSTLGQGAEISVYLPQSIIDIAQDSEPEQGVREPVSSEFRL